VLPTLGRLSGQAEKGQTSLKFIFLPLFYVILAKSKKYYTFKPKVIQKVKNKKGSDFFLSGQIFPPD
jgi:hypothetical protein